ncbi:MAG: LLM class flavin-dependent oxidoreductase [Chloroflexota bacterium]|nr:LLM class flavin-dependent oxidoreductase [Chloroflexota bacterium]
MKIRIGVGLGAGGASDSATFAGAVQSMERLGFDSLWLSEVLTGGVVDPLAGLAFAGGFTKKLKLGTTLTVTGRNPIRLAKELATLDRFSNGRLLLVFVPGLTDRLEDQALGVPVAERGAWIEEVLPLVRRLWSEDEVWHTGPRFRYEGLSLLPRPLQQPLEVWLGGAARSALRRAGRLSDGWLPSLCTPEEAAAGRAAIETAAAEVGRRVDPEHFGISLGYARGEIPDAQAARVAKRRPGLDPAAVIPVGMPGVRRMLERYIDVGFSKFVVRPGQTPESWPAELEQLAEGVLPLQT